LQYTPVNISIVKISLDSTEIKRLYIKINHGQSIKADPSDATLKLGNQHWIGLAVT
jgi:hypothetical protein